MFYVCMSDLSIITTELKALRNEAGMSVRDVADALGISSSAYSHYELRYKRPFLPMEFAQSLARVFAPRGVSRERVLALAGNTTPALPANGPDFAPGVMVDIYNVQASAGHGALVDSEMIVDRLSFPPGYLRQITSSHPRNLAIIGVKGDSMQNTLADGDLVMIDTSKRDLSFDGLFVLQDGGASLLVKRIGRAARRGWVKLISDNKVYDAIEREVSEIDVVGKVIWKGVKE